MLLDLEDLVRAGLLRHEEVDQLSAGEPWWVNFAQVRSQKGPLLHRAAARLRQRPKHPWRPALELFRSEQIWLEDAALFHALLKRERSPWWEWRPGLRERRPKTLKVLRQELADKLEEFTILQFFFERQWGLLQQKAKARGIEIIGDLPIYVDANSVDVWAHQDLFLLDKEGRRDQVAGVPPDDFSPKGQLWGNPLYNWERMAETGYSWWIQRMQRALSLTDRVRIDHFRAFADYWAIPADSKDATQGRWCPGPGMEFFKALEDALGELPVLAEDLGIIGERVRQLLKESGLPGMKVLQFAFGDTPENAYLPHNHKQHSVVYSGTHDNETTLGWWFGSDERVRDHVRRYFGIDGHDLVWDIIRATLNSVADTAIITMQDILCLDNRGRMNIPAEPLGNWEWRMHEDALKPENAWRLRELNGLYGRLPISGA